MLHTFGKYCTSPCGSNPANGNGSLGLATTYAVEVVRHPIVWCCFHRLTTSVIAESPDFGVSRKHSALTEHAARVDFVPQLNKGNSKLKHSLVPRLCLEGQAEPARQRVTRRSPITRETSFCVVFLPSVRSRSGYCSTVDFCTHIVPAGVSSLCGRQLPTIVTLTLWQTGKFRTAPLLNASDSHNVPFFMQNGSHAVQIPIAASTTSGMVVSSALLTTPISKIASRFGFRATVHEMPWQRNH